MAINSGMYNRPMTEEEERMMMSQSLRGNNNMMMADNNTAMPENYNIDSSNYSTMIQQIRDKELADMGLSYMELDKIYEEYGYDTLEAKEAIKRLQVIKGLKMDDTMSIMGR